MNIRDSYIHGADGRGVVKSLFFATAADVQANSALHVNDLVFLLADTLGTQVPLTIPTLNQNTTGYASSLLTVKSTSTSNHYLTFVDSNNTTAEAESFYTSGDIYFKPSTGVLTVKSVTVNNTFNYSGIGSDTTSNAARKIWFASSSDGTPVVSDNFKYNPSTKTLTVDKISGPTIVIGNTTLYLDGANNVLTPDTVINNTSTNNTIPSSKAVWDAILTGMQANDAMVFKGFLTGGADVAHTAYTPGADRGDTYKVQTAGYINGEYYQVNDTFICTTDGTVAADSNKTTAQMNAIKANWGVVEGNGDYLNYNGGTMYGTLSWDGTTALPTVTTASSILVVDSNTTKQISLANLKTALAVADSTHTHSVKIHGNTKTITAPGETAVDLGNYVYTTGDSMTGKLYISFDLTTSEAKVAPTDQLLVVNGPSKPSGGWTTGQIANMKLYPGIGFHMPSVTYASLIFTGEFRFVNSAYNGYVNTRAAKFITNGGTSTDFVKGDGSLDSNTYAYSGNISQSANPVSIGWNTSTTIATIAGVDINVKIPANPNTNTWRNIYTGGTSRVGTGIDTKAMNIASSNLDITYLAAGTSTGQSGNANYFTINLEAKNWSGATSSTAGTAGYMPGATVANRLKFLRGDGNWVTLSETDHTHSVKINGVEKIIAASGGTAVDLGSYLPLTGGTVTGAVKVKKDLGGNLADWVQKQHDGPFEAGRSTNSMCVTIGVTDDDYGYIQCKGAGIITPGKLVLLPAGGDTLYFGSGLKLIAHAGNISNKAAVIGTTATTLATIAGVNITAKIPDVTAQATQLAKVTKTLAVSTWTDMGAVSGLDAGTYAIQISSGNVYASGVFTACGGTDSVIDEIPLHVADKGTNTWRPYARISAGQLQMTTNEVTGTSREYTIKILKLI